MSEQTTAAKTNLRIEILRKVDCAKDSSTLS